MSYSDNITTSLENSRNCLRRIARNDDKEFSHQSILNVMETFVKTVNLMDETILVPCRLMDMKVGDENDPKAEAQQQQQQKKNAKKETVHELLNASDLFEVYSMLNTVKDGLLWGGEAATDASATTTLVEPPTKKGHVRRPSTVSVASTNSTASTISDSESDAGSTNENDSGIEESQELFEENTQRVATDFRRHLHGLTRSLRQMTEAANYLTSRYQHDIGGGSV